MVLSITWGTKVINVPRADMPLIQASPEIRELNLNSFRLSLKDLEDGEDGMPFPNTHNHNTEVTLSGLTYARIVEVINGYTVEFEDAQYAVNCVGANHNLSDVKVANQVSLIVNNAAGLITNSAIEYASFNGGVTIDVVNGVSGSVYNIGTLANPVNNIPDGLIIANAPGRGFEKFHIHGDLTLGTGHNVDGYEFEGHSPDKTTITIEAGASTVGCSFKECKITGILDGDTILDHCVVNSLSYVNGEIRNSNLVGPITLGGGSDAIFMACGSAIPTAPPVIDMGGTGQTCVFHDYSGGLKFQNMTGSDYIGVQLDGGKVLLDSTITAGTVIIVGIGILIDTVGNPILTGTWNGGVTVKNYLVNTETVANAVWDYSDATALNADVKSLLGLGHENIYIDQTVFDGDHNLISARVRIYSAAGSVGSASDVIDTYIITAVGSGPGEFSTFKQVKQ